VKSDKKRFKSLAEIGSKFDETAEARAKTGRAPPSSSEVEQRKASSAKHSERVFHGGDVGSGARSR
jgi:hypothetical protein